MKEAFTIVLLLITGILASGQNKKQYQYQNNIPTRNGIQLYIDQNKVSILHTVENFIGDSIVSYNILADNLSEYQDCDSLESGRFYPEDQIIITNEQKFYDYELNFVPKLKQRKFDNNTKFVKGVLIHEFVHLYIYQFIYDCLRKNIPINSEYYNFNIFPNKKSYYASEFIEEGICEYVVMKLREGIFSEYKPEWTDGDTDANLTSFKRIQNTQGIKYQYSRTYVEKIFENNSFKNALLILFTSKPPSYEELLYPDRYYQRVLNQDENIVK